MKVFLVDDSAIVLEKLAAMISGIEGVEIAGQALNARDAIESIVKLKPDVAILDNWNSAWASAPPTAGSSATHPGWRNSSNISTALPIRTRRF